MEKLVHKKQNVTKCNGAGTCDWTCDSYFGMWLTQASTDEKHGAMEADKSIRSVLSDAFLRWNKQKRHTATTFSTWVSTILRFGWSSFSEVISLCPLLLQWFSGTGELSPPAGVDRNTHPFSFADFLLILLQLCSTLERKLYWSVPSPWNWSS